MSRLRAARFVADLDSSVNMVRALGRFFKGKDHSGLSVGPGSRRLAKLASSPPPALRRLGFIAGSLGQAVPLDRARLIDVEEIDEWVTRQYGAGPFDTVVIGAASGAGVHLAAALGAPFLPQTTLVAVRDLATHPDDPVGAMEALAPTARLVARHNPGVAVYHMHDPAQDRASMQAMAYMRFKRLRLSRAYRDFLEQRLAPGATIVQFECERTWRVRTIGERAYFQFGCLGGVSEEEYHDSGERIAKFLAAEDSPRRSWEPPQTNTRRPDAEWGWEPALGEDVQALADRCGYGLRHLVFDEPQDLSPFVADFHRWWYRRLDVPADRLLVECYVQWDPYWVLRLGVVPFWLRFNMEPSYEELRAYLERAEPYARIYLNLFSPGLASPGFVPVDKWRQLIESKAREHAEVVGVDEDAYPVDTGGTMRFSPAFRALPFRHPIPAPVSADDIDTFLGESAGDYPKVGWR
ncbi:MAG TPA: hypothetical protein VGV93_04040 [Acidimicrobiales bacterium]|nr:hypothetical protein [Acidimicrobiales bacterium]